MNRMKGFMRKISALIIAAILCGMLMPIGVQADSKTKYYIGYFFSKGLVLVSDKKTGGKYGFMDEKGDIVIPIKYDSVEEFREGLAAVKRNGK